MRKVLDDAENISIHALRGEGDAMGLQKSSDWLLFLSTPSVGRATSIINKPRHNISNFYPRPPWGGRPRPCPPYRPQGKISIHALRGEGDKDLIPTIPNSINFYPRPPWGGRLRYRALSARLRKFLSTPSVGRATAFQPVQQCFPPFLSTPSVGRATNRAAHCCADRTHFYPRPPRGGRH